MLKLSLLVEILRRVQSTVNQRVSMFNAIILTSAGNYLLRLFFAVVIISGLFQVCSVDIHAEGKSDKKAKKLMCVTFDELPVSKSFGGVDRQAITYLILETLKKHEVKSAGFVVGEYIEESYNVLGEWLNNGHYLGNLTYSYQDFNQLDPENFISDIRAGSDALETMLSGFGQKKRYFRFPYLHYGSTVETKRAVKLYLDEHDIVTAHATILTEDYLYNLSLERMGKIPDSAEYEALMNDYINGVLDEIERVEKIAQNVLRRPCRQILQLRANRLNAVFLDEMLTAIENMGYKFISLDEALKDDLYSAPEAYYGLRGRGYLEMIQLSNPDLLPAE